MKRRPQLPELLEAANAELGSSQLSERELNQLAAELELSAAEPVRPTAIRREKLLTAVQEGPSRYAPMFDKLCDLFDLGLDQVKAVLERARDTSQWTGMPVPGVQLFHLQGGPATAGADVGLVMLEPGTAFPYHKHLGSEDGVILEGGYVDDSGQLYRAGDRHAMEQGTAHSYRVLPDHRCVFAVVVGPLEFPPPPEPSQG